MSSWEITRGRHLCSKRLIRVSEKLHDRGERGERSVWNYPMECTLSFQNQNSNIQLAVLVRSCYTCRCYSLKNCFKIVFNKYVMKCTNFFSQKMALWKWGVLQWAKEDVEKAFESPCPLGYLFRLMIALCLLGPGFDLWQRKVVESLFLPSPMARSVSHVFIEVTQPPHDSFL